jgi:cell division transport system permease protein
VIIQQLTYFLRETLNSLWQFRIRNLFSVTIICLSFLVVGIFLSLSNNLKYTAKQISENMVAVLFLENGLTSEEVDAIRQELENSPMVLNYQFTDKEQARNRFKEKFPELQGLVEDLEKNPFPPSFEVTLKEKILSTSQSSDFIQDMRTFPGIDDVQFNQEWVERMHSLSRLARAIGFFLGGILVLASLFIISNIIKLNVFARKDEIEILRLVGASNSFVRAPFLMEGSILGMLGGILSIILLTALIEIFPIYLSTAPGILTELISFRYLTFSQGLSLILAGAITGFFGSFTSLARFLKT